jgi:hypothetical protein
MASSKNKKRRPPRGGIAHLIDDGLLLAYLAAAPAWPVLARAARRELGGRRRARSPVSRAKGAR